MRAWRRSTSNQAGRQPTPSELCAADFKPRHYPKMTPDSRRSYVDATEAAMLKVLAPVVESSEPAADAT